MAYQVTVIPVMIASPGDLSEERDIIRSVIQGWNDVNAEVSKIILAPVEWEAHSSPELGARHQELINNRTLKDCDLLVGVFWTRLVSPTGKTKSGTAEEIEEHIASGKPAMIYFSAKPVAPDSLNLEQYAEVRAFKDKCKNKLGSIEEFENTEQLKSKFAKQLPLCLSQNDYIKSMIKQLVDQKVEIVQQIEVPSIIERISVEAKILLKAAAGQNDGTILKLSFFGGSSIQAGGQYFGGERGREADKWEAVLDELISLNLVVAKGSQGGMFELTNHGWEVAGAV